jgi:hypothetical protein
MLSAARFETDEAVIRAVRTWLREQDKARYRQGLYTLIPRWRKAVQVDGDFVNKNRVRYKISPFIMCNFHDLGTNYYREKIWGITF